MGVAPCRSLPTTSRSSTRTREGVGDTFPDFTTPIHAIASYEDGAFVLRPVGIPDVEVTRRLDDDGHLVWTRPDLGGGLVVTLERVGDGAGTPPNTFRRP